MDAKIKKGQISIFIIIGIILIVAVIFFFAFKGNKIIKKISGEDINPNIFLESCIENKIKETAQVIGKQGGYVESQFAKRFKFSDEEDYSEISYLCYTENYYVPCVNQNPMLIQHIKNEIKNEIKTEVKNCYEALINELKEKNYEVESKYFDFEIDFIPKKINLNINAEISMEKNEVKSTQKKFKVSVNSYLYDLSTIAQEILNQEGQYCNFELGGFMLLNPVFEIDKFKTGDSEIIYTLKHKKSKEIFRFAVRGCVIPAGM